MSEQDMKELLEHLYSLDDEQKCSFFKEINKCNLSLPLSEQERKIHMNNAIQFYKLGGGPTMVDALTGMRKKKEQGWRR